MHTIGLTGTCRLEVTPARTAAAVGSGTLAVCATPVVAAAAEGAAVAALAAHLAQGATTVGTQISLDHIAATPVGMTVTATAEVIRHEGRTYEFRFSCSDESGEIARGTHTRVEVDSERFMAKAARRLP